MKTIFILSAFLCSGITFAQTSKRITQLESKLKKSYYLTLFPETNISFYANKYACLQKEYKIKPDTEKEFLNKKEFLKRYPDYLIQEDRTIENSSILQEALKNDHFNTITNQNEVFPKCIKKED